jgi:hypothetical protein
MPGLKPIGLSPVLIRHRVGCWYMPVDFANHRLPTFVLLVKAPGNMLQSVGSGMPAQVAVAGEGWCA